MPLYEYRCEACGGNEEKLQSISAPSEHDCPRCGASAGMKRQLSVTAFSLSGGGWYAQGYGSEKGAASKESAPAPAGGCAGCPCAGSH
ncbi:MAG: regulatory protein, FmdB family [Holophagaceae bacterium]|nr:regulatory protein, FmdB family [Holophagaceae bacterium]